MGDFLQEALAAGLVVGESQALLARLPPASVDLILTSPPYADARAYSRIPPDQYEAWFSPYAQAMQTVLKPSGSLLLNINDRIARSGPLRGQRHPYVYRLVLALQEAGWRWMETYIWEKPNAMPGRFGPRLKDAFEYVYHFARGDRPYVDVDAVRVPYKTEAAEIAQRQTRGSRRRTTAAGFGRDRARTYGRGGADPGNVISIPQSYNQHNGVAHTAPMPEALADFFIRFACPPRGIVIDPFAGSGTTVLAARRLGRQAAGFDRQGPFVVAGRERLRILSAAP